MCSVMYLETYLDSLESLPTELQKSFTLMRDLDSKVQGILKDVDNETTSYIDNTAKMSPTKRREATEKIGKMYTRAKALADDKVQLAMATYENVDKHIRRLDTELTRFENELKEKLLSSSSAAVGGAQGKGTGGTPGGIGEKRKKGDGRKSRGGAVDGAVVGASVGGATPGGGQRQRKKSKNAADTLLIDSDPLLLPSLQSMTNGVGDLMDMPVDPNEPTYCLCHQVSYGEMIGCDNPDCPIEWFHFACVGLSTKPKGKWFCPKCGPPAPPAGNTTEKRKK